MEQPEEKTAQQHFADQSLIAQAALRDVRDGGTIAGRLEALSGKRKPSADAYIEASSAISKMCDLFIDVELELFETRKTADAAVANVEQLKQSFEDLVSQARAVHSRLCRYTGNEQEVKPGYFSLTMLFEAVNDLLHRPISALPPAQQNETLQPDEPFVVLRGSSVADVRAMWAIARERREENPELAVRFQKYYNKLTQPRPKDLYRNTRTDTKVEIVIVSNVTDAGEPSAWQYGFSPMVTYRELGSTLVFSKGLDQFYREYELMARHEGQKA